MLVVNECDVTIQEMSVGCWFFMFEAEEKSQKVTGREGSSSGGVASEIFCTDLEVLRTDRA